MRESTDLDNEIELNRSLQRIGERRPVVHAIVNHVAMAAVADAIRAVGGAPVMAGAVEEAAEVTSRSSALLLNTGTPDERRFGACLQAGEAANRHDLPIVLDPVGMGLSSWRTAAIKRLLDTVRCTAIRGNASEIAALVGRLPTLRGIEAGPEAAFNDSVQIAVAARAKTGAVVCITGPEDVVVGEQIVLIRNGHPLMGEVTGCGCMLGGIIAAFLAVESNVEKAVWQAVVTFGLAGESAARVVQGPGSFRVALIDALAQMQRERTARGVLMEVLP